MAVSMAAWRVVSKVASSEDLMVGARVGKSVAMKASSKVVRLVIVTVA